MAEVDVRNLRYLDAAWMQVLLSLQKTVNETGQAFVVRAVSPDVAKLFELCGIDGHLRWEPAAAETETAA